MIAALADPRTDDGAAEPIGLALSHVILGAVFYIVFTPVGLVMRLLGKDPLHRRFDRAAADVRSLLSEDGARSR